MLSRMGLTLCGSTALTAGWELTLPADFCLLPTADCLVKAA